MEKSRQHPWQQSEARRQEPGVPKDDRAQRAPTPVGHSPGLAEWGLSAHRCSQVPALCGNSSLTPSPLQRVGQPLPEVLPSCECHFRQPPCPTRPPGGWLTVDPAHELFQHLHFHLDPRLGEGVVVLKKTKSVTHSHETLRGDTAVDTGGPALRLAHTRGAGCRHLPQQCPPARL